MSKTTFQNRIIGYDVKPADQFQAHPLNWRKHPQKQRAAVNASLRELGWVAAVIENVRTGNLIDGHERVWQALDKNEPVPYLKVDLSEEEERLALATFDAITGMAETDAAKLDELLREVNTGEAALQEMLAELAESAGIVPGGAAEAGDAEAQVDRAEELRREWGVEPGQLWRLPSRTAGQEHRLICGDCTDNAVVDGFHDDCDVLLFDPEWDSMPQAIAGYGQVLAFCDGATIGEIVDRYGAPTWLFAWDCVTSWYTPNRPLKRMKLCAWYGELSQYEFDGWHHGDSGKSRVVHNTRGEYVFHPDPRGKHLSDLFSEPITKLHAESEHSHSKPAGWVTMLIANCTQGNVYDPYSGSGTTIIAAENIGRQCRAVEISPGYVAVALQRYLDAFGIRAELTE